MFYQIFLPAIFFLIPLLYLPFTPNIFSTPKVILLILAILMTILATTLTNLLHRHFRSSSSPLRFALGSFAFVIILNLIMNPEGRIEALIGPGCTYLALCAWSYFLTLHDSQALKKNLVHMLLAASSLLSLHTILQLTILSRLNFLPAYMQTRGFTPTGAPITTFIFLLFGLGTSLILLSRSTRFQLRSLFTFTTALHIISLIALGFLLLPGQELAFHLLPWTASWSIALDALKNMKSLFFGVGLSGYTDFTASVKPLFLNSTIFWDQTISSATSELLQLLTTTGIIGFLTYLSLPLVAFQLNSKIDFKADTIRLCLLLLAAVSFLTLVFTPSTLPILFVFFTAIGALSATPTRTHNLSLGVSLLTGLVSILVAIFVGYYTYQAYTAEWHMRNAQLGVISNNGKVVYDESLAAVKLMPNLTSYHLSYSQVNLSLASALSQKSPLSDSDRQNVTQLVAQAVNEAKNATILRPHSAVVWQNLGSIYRNLINVADGSDQFAISAYAQALTLDPGNPGLRLEYGGLLYQLGVASKNASDQTTLFTRAQSEFQTAISVKPDYANAYYNLSKLLESSKDYSNAYLSLQKAISLLGPESQDLGRASAELETLKAKVPKSTPAPSTIPSTATTPTLSNPSPLPSPISGDKIPLPTPTP